MQSLQQQATTRSGVKQEDAFAIDEVNLYQRLGRDPFVKLSTNFYNRVYEDEQQWFRSIFANSRKEEAIQNQYEFFIQRMGGPPLYSQRKGHPALIGRHAPYAITEQAAVRWLEHMQAAIDSTPEIDPDSKKLMLNFLKSRERRMNLLTSPANIAENSYNLQSTRPSCMLHNSPI